MTENNNKVELNSDVVRDLFYLMRDILETTTRSNLSPQELEKLNKRLNFAYSQVLPQEFATN